MTVPLVAPPAWSKRTNRLLARTNRRAMALVEAGARAAGGRQWVPSYGRGQGPHRWNETGIGRALAVTLRDGATVFLGWCDMRLASEGRLDQEHHPFFVDFEVFAPETGDVPIHEGVPLAPLAARRVLTSNILIHKERVFASRLEAVGWYRWLKHCVDTLSDAQLAGCYHPGASS